MDIYEKVSLKQARADLQYLKDTYGDPYDFCGCFCNSYGLEDILFGRKTVKETIIALIEYYFENRVEDFDGELKKLEDKRIQRIAERYNIIIS